MQKWGKNEENEFKFFLITHENITVQCSFEIFEFSLLTHIAGIADPQKWRFILFYMHGNFGYPKMSENEQFWYAILKQLFVLNFEHSRYSRLKTLIPTGIILCLAPEKNQEKYSRGIAGCRLCFGYIYSRSRCKKSSHSSKQSYSQIWKWPFFTIFHFEK